MMAYEQRMQNYVKAINDGLQMRMPSVENAAQGKLVEAIKYGVLDGGKRIRGALTMEFCRLAKGDAAAGVAMACAVEMIHAYSLIHDDLPCMDNDDMRRGKPSCHKQFGETIALLAGDALLTGAFETVVRAPVSPEQRCKAVLTLAQNAGVDGMIGGQMMDMSMGTQDVDEAYLTVMDEKKTSRLLCAACLLGCHIGSAGSLMEEAAVVYGTELGIAFQITDDILDVIGESKVLGKQVGSDEANKKRTSVSVLGLERAKWRAGEHLQKARAAVNALPDNGFLHWVLDTIMVRKK